MSNQSRTPPGVPTGGQFSGTPHDEADATLEADQSVMGLFPDPDMVGSSDYLTVHDFVGDMVDGARHFKQDETEAAIEGLDALIDTATEMRQKLTGPAPEPTDLGTKRAQLAELEAEFAENGGRGVEDADAIDRLRSQIRGDEETLVALAKGTDGHKELSSWIEQYDADPDTDPTWQLDSIVSAARVAVAQHQDTPQPITGPLTQAEVAARVDDQGFISGYVTVDEADLIDGDVESVCDLYSERLIGRIDATEIDGTIVGSGPNGLTVLVRLNATEALDDPDWE